MPSRRSVSSRTKRAVVVQVVARAQCRYQGCVPDVERLDEAVDVLGHAELLDPALGGRLAVALGVGGGEVALGRGVAPGPGGGGRGSRSAPRAEDRLGHAQVELGGDLEVVRRAPPPRAPVPPARSTSDASSVAAASTSALASSARRSTSARNTCGVCTAHSLSRSSVRTTRPAASASLTVSVTGAAAIAPSTPSRAVDAALHQLAGHERPRGVVHHDHGGLGRCGQGVAHRLRAPVAARARGRAAPRSPAGTATTTRVADVGERGRGSSRASACRHRRRTPWARRHQGVRRCRRRERSRRRTRSAQSATTRPWPARRSCSCARP